VNRCRTKLNHCQPCLCVYKTIIGGGGIHGALYVCRPWNPNPNIWSIIARYILVWMYIGRELLLIKRNYDRISSRVLSFKL
jgi:hypothetical protein